MKQAKTYPKDKDGADHEKRFLKLFGYIQAGEIYELCTKI